MMTFGRMANYVGAEPFRPFRIKMASGDTYDIRHPEMIAVGRTTVHVFSWMDDPEAEEEPMERECEVSILLIEAIEPLDGSVKQNPNRN